MLQQKLIEPIMDRALIYIDDILLLSPTEESHIQLLQQFVDLVHSRGIRLFEKMMIIGQKEIKFLGMSIKEGQYQPEPHVEHELLKYPEEFMTKK